MKSVKKSGSDKYSNRVYSTARLNKPVITDWDNTSKTGKIKITWTKVKNADKYYIYRSRNGSAYKYFAATTKTSFTDTKAADPSKNFSYKVKAIYSKNTKGNSYMSEASYWMNPRLASPKVTYTLDETTNQLILSWKKVPYAASYYLGSFENQNYDWYTQIGYTQELTYTIDLNRYYAGCTYEFWVQAIPSSGYSSVISDFVTITIPSNEIM